jgi:prepilin-type processing-associated H-X9-DG protein
MSLAMLVACVLALRVPGAGTPFDPEATARAVAPYVDEQAIALAHVDVARLNLEALTAKLQDAGKIQAKDLPQAWEALRAWVPEFVNAGGRELFVVVSLADLPNHSLVVVSLEAGNDGRALTEFLRSKSTAHLAELIAAPLGGPVVEKVDSAIVVGTKEAVARVRGGRLAARPELARALAAAGDSAFQLLLLPTRDVRRVIEDVYPALPPEAGGGPASVVTQGVRWAALCADLSAKARARLVVQSRDDDAARRLREAIMTALASLGRGGSSGELARTRIEALRQILTPSQAEDRLTWHADLADAPVIGLVASVAGPLAARDSRTSCVNKLKQIALAMHNYHDVNQHFPAVASFDKDGKPLLSWRVHLLPFLEQNELYKEFHLDEPWDSEHNRKLIAKMPAIFRCPSTRAELGRTTYVVPVGPSTIFTGGPQGIPIKEINDGTSNTIMVLDAADSHAVIWTQPDDLKVDLKQPRAGLVEHHPGGFNAALADGSVRLIAETVSDKTLAAAFTRSGGEILGPDW